MPPETHSANSGPAGKRGSVLHPMEWATQSGVAAEVLARLERRLQRRRRAQAALSSVAALMLAGTVAWQVRGRAPTEARAPASTIVVNAPAGQVLPDGSRVELRPGAVIRLEFSDAIRRVVLERGEAHFAVTKNVERPFVVQAGAVEARAVGTAFSVELTSSRTEVVVTEGKVAVQRPVVPVSPAPAVDGAASEVEMLALLGAGHRAVIEASAPASGATTAAVEELSASALGERLAWRVPTLEFSGTPLEDAIPMLNRHGAVRLVLAERGVGAVRLSGVIRADNTETLLRLLKEEHGIAAERRADGEVVLSRAR